MEFDGGEYAPSGRGLHHQSIRPGLRQHGRSYQRAEASDPHQAFPARWQPALAHVLRQRGGRQDAAKNEKFTKERARGRIDGAVAAAMAVGRVIANEVTPSPYESREGGFLFI